VEEKRCDMKRTAILTMILVIFVISNLFAQEKRGVEYQDFLEQKFSSRSQPAELSTLSEGDLLSDGYARIGEIEVEHVIDRYFFTDKGKDHEKITHPLDLTSDLLSEAARKGGDIVVLTSKEIKITRQIRKKGKCLYWATMRSYQFVYNAQTQNYVYKWVPFRYCALYEELEGEEIASFSKGIVWRREPDLAELQRIGWELITAAREGSVEHLRELLQQGVNIESMFDGRLALSVAAENGHIDAVKFLIERGADINAIDELGTALHRAASRNRLDMVRFLISKGADVNISDTIVKGSLNSGTPLFDAAEIGSVEIIKELLAHGANADEKTEDGVTPLMMAVASGNIEAVRTLLDAGAKVNAKSEELVMSATFVMNFTPLAIAAVSNNMDMVIELLKRGATTYENVAGYKNVEDLPQLTPRMRHFLQGYINGAYGFVNKDGKLVAEPEFRFATNFSEGLASVKYRNGKWGYIDRTGAFVIEPKFDDARRFSEGLAGVQEGDKWGYINKSGNWIVEPLMSDVREFSEGLAAVELKDIKWCYIDKNGQVVLPPKYDSASSFQEGLAVVSIKEKSRLMDKSGNFVTGQLETLVSFYEGLANAGSGGKFGYLDKSGKWAIKPQFPIISRFSEGLAAMRVGKKMKDWKYGYIDKSGNWVIEPQFEDAGPFSDGLARVKIKKAGDEW
jgi:ankyrin repeat protein